MHVNFKKIKFRNFLSYGNCWTELEFNNKLNIINAQNGSGKSTIIDAISFVLFGKPYRDIKMKSLVNYINHKNLEVEIEFSIGDDNYTIFRGLSPTKFDMKKNGEKIEALSSKKLNQHEIDKLLGVKFLLFKNVMCIGTISNEPFFTMALPDRRELLETIFGLSNIADMLDEVKERKSNNVISSKTKTASKTGIANSISDLTQIVNDIELKRKKFSENQSERIKRIEDHIDSQKNDISKREYNISKCEEKLSELDMEIGSSADDLISERRETTSELAKRTARIDEVSKILINRDKPVCPICGSDLCSDHAKGYFDDLEKEKISLIEEREILENSDRQIEISINRAREKEAFKEKLRTRIEQEKRSIETLKSGIDYDEKQIESIKSETNDFDSSSTRAKLDEYKKQLEIVTAELDDLSEKIAVDMDLITILSDGGIKRYFFEEIIPILNQKVNEYVEKFGLNLVISFNNMLEYTISKGSFELEYNGLSNGEKTRVNVAMLLTFYDIAKQLSNWSSSILFMDEIFDSGVDSDGISDFLRELISMLNRDEKLGVYLISHKLNDVNFSQIQYKFETLRVQKKGAFSQIVKG